MREKATCFKPPRKNIFTYIYKWKNFICRVCMVLSVSFYSYSRVQFIFLLLFLLILFATSVSSDIATFVLQFFSFALFPRPIFSNFIRSSLFSAITIFNHLHDVNTESQLKWYYSVIQVTITLYSFYYKFNEITRNGKYKNSFLLYNYSSSNCSFIVNCYLYNHSNC